jgi:glycosyltransferase involved in cell wall biosynthesis
VADPSDRDRRVRTLALVTTGYGRPRLEELRALEQADLCPRAALFQDRLSADLLDERWLRGRPARYKVLSMLPDVAAQVYEAFLVRNNYDAVISWAERLALPFAALLKATGSPTPHIAIVSWISKPKKALLLKNVQSHIDRLVTGSSRQRDFAIHELGLPDHKVVHLKLFVDQKFFRPMDAEEDAICSVGQEMRDYSTLIEAVRPLANLRCHIAAGGAQVGPIASSVGIRHLSRDLPPHMTLGKLPYLDLRRLYARSRFVVIPLLQSDTDNGVTAILEAMAMGKAVICSRTRGQIDVIEEGVTGLFVPPGDPRALRAAIEYLRNHPAVAKAMGREARQRVEQNHTIDGYMNDLLSLVVEAIAERRSRGRLNSAEAS